MKQALLFLVVLLAEWASRPCIAASVTQDLALYSAADPANEATYAEVSYLDSTARAALTNVLSFEVTLDDGEAIGSASVSVGGAEWAVYDPAANTTVTISGDLATAGANFIVDDSSPPVVSARLEIPQPVDIALGLTDVEYVGVVAVVDSPNPTETSAVVPQKYKNCGDLTWGLVLTSDPALGACTLTYSAGCAEGVYPAPDTSASSLILSSRDEYQDSFGDAATALDWTSGPNADGVSFDVSVSRTYDVSAYNSPKSYLASLQMVPEDGVVTTTWDAATVDQADDEQFSVAGCDELLWQYCESNDDSISPFFPGLDGNSLPQGLLCAREGDAEEQDETCFGLEVLPQTSINPLASDQLRLTFTCQGDLEMFWEDEANDGAFAVKTLTCGRQSLWWEEEQDFVRTWPVSCGYVRSGANVTSFGLYDGLATADYLDATPVSANSPEQTDEQSFKAEFLVSAEFGYAWNAVTFRRDGDIVASVASDDLANPDCGSLQSGCMSVTDVGGETGFGSYEAVLTIETVTADMGGEWSVEVAVGMDSDTVGMSAEYFAIKDCADPDWGYQPSSNTAACTVTYSAGCPHSVYPPPDVDDSYVDLTTDDDFESFDEEWSVAGADWDFSEDDGTGTGAYDFRTSEVYLPVTKGSPKHYSSSLRIAAAASEGDQSWDTVEESYTIDDFAVEGCDKDLLLYCDDDDANDPSGDVVFPGLDGDDLPDGLLCSIAGGDFVDAPHGFDCFGDEVLPDTTVAATLDLAFECQEDLIAFWATQADGTPKRLSCSAGSFYWEEEEATKGAWPTSCGYVESGAEVDPIELHYSDVVVNTGTEYLDATPISADSTVTRPQEMRVAFRVSQDYDFAYGSVSFSLGGAVAATVNSRGITNCPSDGPLGDVTNCLIEVEEVGVAGFGSYVATLYLDEVTPDLEGNWEVTVAFSSLLGDPEVSSGPNDIAVVKGCIDPTWGFSLFRTGVCSFSYSFRCPNTVYPALDDDAAFFGVISTSANSDGSLFPLEPVEEYQEQEAGVRSARSSPLPPFEYVVVGNRTSYEVSDASPKDLEVKVSVALGGYVVQEYTNDLDAFNPDGSGCPDVVSWCQDPNAEDKDTPWLPSLQAAGLTLADAGLNCSYVDGTEEQAVKANRLFPCRNEVRPRGFRPLRVQFDCPEGCVKDWAADVDFSSDLTKTVECGRGSNYWREVDETEGYWPTCDCDVGTTGGAPAGAPLSAFISALALVAFVALAA